jgi:methylated-DNA-[protein]-cysteine S-methyltransferase
VEATAAFTTFDTAVGRCALLWKGSRIAGAALPDVQEGRLPASLARRFPGARIQSPSLEASGAIRLIQRLLEGEATDLSMIEIDLEGCTAFEREVYAATRMISRGEVRTYGELAGMIGIPGAARAVGAALGRNPIPIIVPCHRVLAAGGKSGGFSAPGGPATKFKLLRIEEARLTAEPQLFGSLPLAIDPTHH